MRRVWKSKKLIDNQNAGASDGHQEEEKKCTHGETLAGHFDWAKARKASRGLNKIGKKYRKNGIKYRVYAVFHNITSHPGLYVLIRLQKLEARCQG
jgi:hypothetical protein